MSAPLLPADRTRDTAGYAIGGARPAQAVRPATAEEAAAVVAACARANLALVPWGGGAGLAHDEAPERYDVALDLAGLTRIVRHERDDFTLTAECGATLDALAALLGRHGQELPLEAAEPARATFGGVLATNASGARRLALGAPRDRILGARFVLGDGTLARTGGRVVKNVAGHAVHRLLVGARGGLGVLLEASVKLLPQPPARAAVVHGADAAMLADAERWAPFPRREPAVLTVTGARAAAGVPALATEAPFAVVTGFEGDPAWVDASIAFATRTLGEPVRVLRDAEVPALWRSLAALRSGPGPHLEFASAHNTPAALQALADRADAGSLVFHAPAGRLHIAPAPGTGAARMAELAAAGFVPIAARGAGAALPEPPAAVRALRGRIADALDPAGTLAFGARWRTGR